MGKRCKSAKKAANFSIGDKVFARVRGYPPWPAIVECVEDSTAKKFRVVFFGTSEIGICKAKDLYVYNERTKQKFGTKKRSRHFVKAMSEIESHSSPTLSNENPSTNISPSTSNLRPDFEPESLSKSSKSLENQGIESLSGNGSALVLPTASSVSKNDDSRKKPKSFCVDLNGPKTNSPAYRDSASEVSFNSFTSEKINWLQTERRLTDINADLRRSIHYQRPNMVRTIELLDEMMSLSVAPLMFKKQPEVVTTVRMLQNYFGPTTNSPPIVSYSKEIADGTKEAPTIRAKARSIYRKIQNLLGALPAGDSFPKFFNSEIASYLEASKLLKHKERLQLVQDPTKRPIVLTL